MSFIEKTPNGGRAKTRPVVILGSGNAAIGEIPDGENPVDQPGAGILPRPDLASFG
jgi:hypothetical protein